MPVKDEWQKTINTGKRFLAIKDFDSKRF